MTTSTRKSCKNLRPRDFIGLKYVIPPTTVVNLKNGDVPQGVHANRFTFPVSVTSISHGAIAPLEGNRLRGGTTRMRMRRAPGECAEAFWGLARLLKKYQAGPLPASDNSCSPPGSRRKILRPSTLINPWVESFANIRERVSGIVPIRLASWPLDMFNST
jgi:hypothetical protein